MYIHIFMCLHIYTHTHTHLYIHTYIHTYIHAYIHPLTRLTVGRWAAHVALYTDINTYTNLCISPDISVYIHTYAYMYIYMFMYAYTHIYIYIYMHIQIHTYNVHNRADSGAVGCRRGLLGSRRCGKYWGQYISLETISLQTEYPCSRLNHSACCVLCEQKPSVQQNTQLLFKYTCIHIQMYLCTVGTCEWCAGWCKCSSCSLVTHKWCTCSLVSAPHADAVLSVHHMLSCHWNAMQMLCREW